jgi:long-chain acyl-CoA synthetase
MNLGTYLDEKVARYREKPLLFYYEETMTYGQFGERVDRLANGLRALGVKAGDFVHVMIPNSPESLISYFAIQKLGAIAGPVNGQWRAKELEYLLNDSGARALIIDHAYAAELMKIRDQCPALKMVIERGEQSQPEHVSLERLIADSPAKPVTCVSNPNDPAYIFYTSGTTGNPKGVLLSHRNVFSDLRGFQDALQLEEGYRILIFLPLFHVNAMLTTTSTLDKGGAVVLRKQFSARGFWKTVETYRVNFFSAVPAIYSILLADPDRDRNDKSSLWFGICGAAPMPVETFQTFERTFNIPLVEGYGLTEGTCVSTLNPRKGVRKVGSIGLPCPGQEVLIIDQRGDPLPVGERGEIVIRGDVVMLGYHNRPEETREALRGGVLHTGDVGYRDADGYIFIVDRLKDMVIRGGENIYPKEIDNVLASHPLVREAACVGVPDPIRGEELKAYVLLNEGAVIDEEELRAYCKEHLAAYKVPKYIQILKRDLPRNAVGKILKKEMKAWGVAGPKDEG